MVASLLFVHTASYEPAVSYILLYFVSSVGIITAAVVVPLLPEEQFTTGFCGSIYALYAAVVAVIDLEQIGGQRFRVGVEPERAVVVRGEAPATDALEEPGPVRLVVARPCRGVPVAAHEVRACEHEGSFLRTGRGDSFAAG